MAEITKYVDKKLVSVNHNGPIYVMGGIYGPTMPQITDVAEIALLIQKQYPVIEHLKNGTEVKLTIANYNIDLSGDAGAYLEDVKGPNEDVQPVPTEAEKEAAAAKVVADAKAAATKSDTAKTSGTPTVTATPVVADKTADTSAKTTVVVSTAASKADPVTAK